MIFFFENNMPNFVRNFKKNIKSNLIGFCLIFDCFIEKKITKFKST